MRLRGGIAVGRPFPVKNTSILESKDFTIHLPMKMLSLNGRKVFRCEYAKGVGFIG